MSIGATNLSTSRQADLDAAFLTSKRLSGRKFHHVYLEVMISFETNCCAAFAPASFSEMLTVAATVDATPLSLPFCPLLLCVPERAPSFCLCD